MPFLPTLEAYAQLASALFTALAAAAAAYGALAARKAAQEAEATRIQSAEPYLRLSVAESFFNFAWRPQNGEPPRMISSFYAPSVTEPCVVISNYGGGPALDVRVTIKAADGDPTSEPATFADPGGVAGYTLTVSDTRIEAVGQNTKPMALSIETQQTAFAPACGNQDSISVPLRSELLMRLLPITMELEKRSYSTTGTPADQGRVRWHVNIKCRTALGKPIEFNATIYAERSRIDYMTANSDGTWFEKHYRCILAIEPTDGFQTTTLPVNATVIAPAPTIVVVDHPFQA